MRVLFVSMVSFHINSSATIQNKGIVRGLVDLGCKVDVLTLKPLECSRSYDRSMNDVDGLIERVFYINHDKKYTLVMAKKTKKGVSSRHKKGFGGVFQRGRHLSKHVYDSIAVFDAQKVNVKNVDDVKMDYSRYDLIISASDPKSSHLIVERIFRGNPDLSVRWIQYWGDPMLHDITRKNKWFNPIVKYRERRLLSRADRVVYASPLTLDKQIATFPEFSHKMDYANQVYASVPSDVDESSGRDDDVLRVGYFGTYYSATRNIMPLYNSGNGSGFMLTICGASDLTLASSENIRIMDSVSYGEVIELEQDSDILVCICNMRGTQIPGKIYYYTSYQKPIIIVLDGEHKDELRRYFNTFKRFILCDNNEESIRVAIEEAKTRLLERYELADELTPKYMAKKILG